MAWRYILAFVLSLAVITLWQSFMVPKPAPRPPQDPGAAPQAPGVATPAPGPGPAPVLPPAKDSRPERERKELDIPVGERLEYVADARGGRLSRAFLPEFHESKESSEAYQLLFEPREGSGTLALDLFLGRSVVPAIPLEENWALNPREPGGVEFSNEVDGIVIKKTVLPGEWSDLGQGAPQGADLPPPRHLKVKIELANASEVEKQLSYRLLGPVGTDTESVQAAGSDLQLVFGTNGSNGQVGVDLLGPGQLTAGNWERGSNIAWVGVSNNYFTGILFPLSSGDSASRHVEKAFAEAYPDSKNLEDLARKTHSMPLSDLGEDAVRALKEKAWKNLRVGLKSVNLVLKPGASVTHEYGLFLGPRARTELDLYGTLEFQGVNYYGWYSLLVKLFMGLLGILKTLSFGSWGVAIILLTFLVKLVLHPINKRSTAGMQRFQKKLQKLKPEMDLLKERFANDRLRQNQETQKLWKKHGVNPGQSMAGCLVIFLQLPVWFGVYATLQYAFGLRQAGFLYISDLTRPDHLFAFGANLPIIGSHFNLLPILYVILTVVNQQLQPKPEDPQMQMQFRMMSIMMVVIGFIFYTSPAGFMLYIMTQAGLSIAESKIIKAELARDETVEAGDASAPTKAMYPMRSKKNEGEDSRDRPRRG